MMNTRPTETTGPVEGLAVPSETIVMDDLPSFSPVEELEVCNLVMKGGVTSGVVFPGTIRVLASVYRFRRIGGTSAGAIAAAFAAAGEYARREYGTTQGFNDIYALGNALSGTPPGGEHKTYLEALFAPNTSTVDVYRLITALSRGENERKSVDTPTPKETRRQTLRFAARVGGALAKLHPVPGALGAAGLVGMVAGSAGLLFRQRGAAGLALAGTWGALASLTWLGNATVVGGLRHVSANHFGLSKGFERGDPNDMTFQVGLTQPARFTAWLHAELQQISRLVTQPTTPGSDVRPVLTFGHLAPGAYSLPSPAKWSSLYKAGAVPNSPLKQEFGELSFKDFQDLQSANALDIDLRQITTNLTFGRPVTMPIDSTSTDAGHLYFRPDEWEQYFPGEIMDHLQRHSGRRIQPLNAAFTYYRLPPPELLPVVVSTRLSMSFPGLFSPVPMHYGWWTDGDQPGRSWRRFRTYGQLRLGAWGPQEDGTFSMEPVVFGDGGLTSNFPLALFDDLSPSEPTFGLDLCTPSEPSSRPAVLIAPSLLRQHGMRDVEKRARWHPAKNPTESLLGYAASIVESARNWSDNAMMGLPGFGERVVHILINSGLGGTNLSMTPTQILALRSRGVAAGKQLIKRFHTGEIVPITHAFGVPWNWDIHNANHFLRLTADLERVLQEYAAAYSTVKSGQVILNVPALKIPTLGQVRVQNNHPFNTSMDASWRARAAALIAVGRETTTLRGYRKLRGRRGWLRYRAMH